MTKAPLLFLIILLEGYVVLACELLAIRLLIPFVGSGVETVAVIISAVLLPLAAGYHAGGRAWRRQAARAKAKSKTPPSVRHLLLKNLQCALLILTLGLSWPCLEMFFTLLTALGITGRIPQAALYSLIFLVKPVYRLGQTVPLISNYFPRRRLSDITGRMLFFSTLGSFLGSIFSTLVLMNFIGVHYTVIFTLGLVTLLILTLARQPRYWYELLLALLAFALVVYLNSGAMMRRYAIVQNNHYSTVAVHDEAGGARLMEINRSASSRIAPDPAARFAYIAWLEDNLLPPHPLAKPLRILVIGAGGFTFGLKDTVNDYSFVDIDPALKATAETYFLKEKLSPNKRFTAAPARAFLRQARERYDLIIVDTYTNTVSIPMETVTREFLQSVKEHLAPGGIVAANIIETPDFSERFARRYENGFRSIFPHYTRQLVKSFNPWEPARAGNVIYVYYDRPGMDDTTAYTDEKNSYSLDR